MADNEPINQLVVELRHAQQDRGECLQRLRACFDECNMQATTAANNRLFAAQRMLAEAMGQDWADPLPWKPRWNIGAPMPHVLSSSHKTILIYLVHEPDPNCDGSYATMVSPSDAAALPLALVQFENCYWHRFGGANDEVFSGHPLASRGFDNQGAYLVRNSQWLEEARAINSVHSQYNPETWRRMQHYLLAFHDETFECLAYSYSVEIHHESFAAALSRCAQKLVG